MPINRNVVRKKTIIRRPPSTPPPRPVRPATPPQVRATQVRPTAWPPASRVPGRPTPPPQVQRTQGGTLQLPPQRPAGGPPTPPARGGGINPATGGRFQPPPAAGQPRSTSGGLAGIDYSVVQKYLPPEIAAAKPATFRGDPDRTPLPTVREWATQERNLQALAASKPPVEPIQKPGEFKIGEPRQPATITGPMVQVADTAERLLNVYQTAEKKVTEAGQGEYRPWAETNTLEDVTYNIGKVPGLGKPLAAIAQGVLVTGELMGEPARVIEKQVFGA